MEPTEQTERRPGTSDSSMTLVVCTAQLPGALRGCARAGIFQSRVERTERNVQAIGNRYELSQRGAKSGCHYNVSIAKFADQCNVIVLDKYNG